MMVIPMGTKGQADFSQPIELLMDCHRRIERFLGVLGQVVARYGGPEAPSLDTQGREALQTALDYFAQAAPRHTADEEESLFPRMRLLDKPDVNAALTELDRLEADHRQAAIAHARVDELGRRWLSSGQLDSSDLKELSALLDEMSAIYDQHIRLEDQRVFVLASKTLDPAALEQMGQEMKARRAQNPGRPGSRCAQRRAKVSSPASSV